MKFNKLECFDVDTRYIGIVNVSFDKLVKVFDEPDICEDNRTDVQWYLEFEDGTLASIYNWKNGKNFLGNSGLLVNNITKWNIGGVNDNAVLRVKKALELI